MIFLFSPDRSLLSELLGIDQWHQPFDVQSHPFVLIQNSLKLIFLNKPLLTKIHCRCGPIAL